MTTDNKMNIAFCTDSGYLKPTAVCISSILENNRNPIDFYILYPELKKSEITFLENLVKKYGGQYSLKAIKITSEAFDSLPIYGRSKAAYFRLLIPDVLPKEADRCLYLDGDTIVYKSLEDFYNMSFDGKALVVNEDMGKIIFDYKERQSLLGIPAEYKYFNSGVLLMNLGWFKNFDMKTVFDWMKNNPDKLKFLDQDVLNANFYDKAKYADGYMNDYLEILVNPLLPNAIMEKATIVHFLKKPWKYAYNGTNANYWWKYGKKIYKWEYIKFSVINFLFRKTLGILLLFVPITLLKKLKK